MSTRYPGGVITKTPVVPAGPYENGTAPGIWTLDQQLQAAKAGIWPTAGNIDPSQFIENIFSTYLYTGNGTTAQTITNGIDLSGKGGLVWTKRRQSSNNALIDTVRGGSNFLASNLSNASYTGSTYINPFTSTGYQISFADGDINASGGTYCSWTFREQPKFFDVVTYTGDGVAGRSIAHNLGSTPGCIIVKCTSLGATDWQVYHIGLGAMPKRIVLNSTNAADSLDHFYATPTSSVFYVNNYQSVNQNAATYVAYLFAHNAGGFGLTGTDNVISCGSFTTDGSGNATVSLGYEPQWILTKRTDAAQSWEVCDNMRSMSVTDRAVLYPNNSDAEYVTTSSLNAPTATGFNISGYGASRSFIYIAIRRGPMKVPTSGTSVFAPIARTGTGATATVTGVGFPPDLGFSKSRNGVGGRGASFMDRLRGAQRDLDSSSTSSEATATDTLSSFNMDGVTLGADTYTAQWNYSSNANIEYFLRRAPGFFDEVCWTGVGGSRNLAHNLNAVPELIITKRRDGTNFWYTYSAAMGNTSLLYLNDPSAVVTGQTIWNSTTPTSSVFSVAATLNGNTLTYVSYLFATVAGVSKVGSYTGTGTTQTINCGFTAGSRFVVIKRTDDTGDWYVWDSARGIVAGNDPYLLLNSTAAEVTSTDYVDTASSGFEISSTAPAAINANGGSFIFLAIA